MTENIAIVGAGISGLCTALALASKKKHVTVYERDSSPPGGGAEEAFFEWNRRGASQFRHPHAFLAVMCNLLQQNYPDLIEQFWQAGARKVSFEDMLPPHIRADYRPAQGDDELWLLMCRRATMETILRRYVDSMPNIEINNTTHVVGLLTEPPTTATTPSQLRSNETDQVGIRVTGLKIQKNRGAIENVIHDTVVDASGRTSKFPAWLTAMGATIRIEDDDAEIVYYTRHYKLNPAELEPSRHGKERSAGDLGYIKYGVFPGDNGNFAIIVCLPNHETELREAVKSGDTFDAICQAIPGLAPWIAQGKSTPTTASFGFGDIHAVWKHYVHDGIPVALNYFVVGDSAVRTNPLYGRGCSTGIIHGHLLSDTLEELSDPLARAIRFDQRTEEALRPIFDTSLAEDKRSIERALAISENRSLDDAGSLKKWFRAAIGDAISAAVRDEIHVLRGAMRTFNLMEKPGDFLKDNHIRWTIFRYLFRGRKRNSQARLQNGPNRQEMLAILQAMLKKEVA